MQHTTEIFIDGLGDVRLHAGMARVDFVVHEADPTQPDAKRRVARLVMTPKALLQVAQGLAQSAGRMVNATATAPVTETKVPTERSSSLAPPVSGRSPNFKSS